MDSQTSNQDDKLLNLVELALRKHMGEDQQLPKFSKQGNSNLMSHTPKSNSKRLQFFS